MRFLYFLLLVYAFPFTGYTQSDSSKINTLIEEGYQLEQAGSLIEGFLKYEEALELLSRDDSNFRLLGLVNMNMGYNLGQRNQLRPSLSFLKGEKFFSTR